MLKNSIRVKAFAISVIFTLCILAILNETELLSKYDLVTRVGGSTVHLDRWMNLCDFELYPNLKWKTVFSQHASGQAVMTVFVPFAVENSWMPGGSDVDDSDFHNCPTSCIWIRSRDTSMESLSRSALCAAQAHAVLFWLPLGHPGQSGDVGTVISASGLIRSSNQVWVSVATEPGYVNAYGSKLLLNFLFQWFLFFWFFFFNVVSHIFFFSCSSSR